MDERLTRPAMPTGLQKHNITEVKVRVCYVNKQIPKIHSNENIKAQIKVPDSDGVNLDVPCQTGACTQTAMTLAGALES